MTYKEFKEKYPIYSRIVTKPVFAKQAFGEIILYNDINEMVLINWDDKACGAMWYLIEYFQNIPFELTQKLGRVNRIGEIESWNPNTSKTCPRCGKEMEKKQSESYGLIDKCQNCGYC